MTPTNQLAARGYPHAREHGHRPVHTKSHSPETRDHSWQQTTIALIPPENRSATLVRLQKARDLSLSR
jgi:hypothetical protein